MHLLIFLLVALLGVAHCSRIFPVINPNFADVSKTAQESELSVASSNLLKEFNLKTFELFDQIRGLKLIRETYPELLQSFKEAQCRFHVYQVLVEKMELSLVTSWKMLFEVICVVSKEMVRSICSGHQKYFQEKEADNLPVNADIHSPMFCYDTELFALTSTWTALQKQLHLDIQELIKEASTTDLVDIRAEIFVDDLTKIMDVIATGMILGDTISGWSKNLVNAVERHFDNIWRIYTEPSFPNNIRRDTLLVLVSLGYRFEDEIRQFHFALQAREARFQIACEIDESKGPYNARKAGCTFASIEDHPMKRLKVVNSVFQLSGTIATSILSSIGNYWDACITDNISLRKHQALQIMIGLEHIGNMINLAVAAANIKTRTTSWDGLKQIHMIMIQIIPVANKAIWRAIEMDIDENVKKSVSVYMSDESKNKAMNGPMFLTVYDMLETQLSKLFKKDPFIATILFKAIELCRGFIVLNENIRLIGGIERNHDIGQLTLMMLDESQKYVSEAFTNNEQDLSTRTYVQIRLFVTHALAGFTYLFTIKKIADDMENSWYAYIEKRIHSDENSKEANKYWSQFREEFAKKMSKKQSIVIEHSEKKKKLPKKHISIKTAKKMRYSKKKTWLKEESDDIEPCIVVEQKSVNCEMGEAIDLPIVTSTTKEFKELVLSTKTPELKSEHLPVLRNNCIPGLKKIGSVRSIKSLISNDSKSFRPKIKTQLMMVPRQPKALQYRVVEKFEEPSHYLVIAKQVGYKNPNIDPRDYLISIILIGQRVWMKKLEPLLMVFQNYEAYSHLVGTFYFSIQDFETELRFIEEMEPDTLQTILNEAGVHGSCALFFYIKYYKLRLSVCHPFYPKTREIRKNIQARLFTALEVSNAVPSCQTNRLRLSTENYAEIFVRAIDTNGRPEYLLTPDHTEAILATIGSYELVPSEDLKFKRNRYSHHEVDDLVYREYLSFIFSKDVDFNLLAEL